MTSFGVETIELDLPPFVRALGRRLHDRGLPLTPARAADFAHALTLVRPVSRRRLYWTARAIFVTDPTQVPAFDEVFLSVFGGEAGGPERSAGRAAAERPQVAEGPGAEERRRDGTSASGDDEEAG